MVFDNQRVLHGRTSYKMEEGGVRHLEGGYVDWDELRSKINVLKRSMKLQPQEEL